MPELESIIASPASSANGIASNPYSTIDPTLVVDHLVAVLNIALSATQKDLENVGSLLSKAKYSDTVQRCTRFATESQVALYVQKDIILETGSDLEGTINDSGN
jgi:dynein heavy chain 1, cytosolic